MRADGCLSLEHFQEPSKCTVPVCLSLLSPSSPTASFVKRPGLAPDLSIGSPWLFLAVPTVSLPLPSPTRYMSLSCKRSDDTFRTYIFCVWPITNSIKNISYAETWPSQSRILKRHSDCFHSRPKENLRGHCLNVLFHAPPKPLSSGKAPEAQVGNHTQHLVTSLFNTLLLLQKQHPQQSLVVSSMSALELFYLKYF